MSPSSPPSDRDPPEPLFPDLDPEEDAELRRAYDEAHEEYLRGESLPEEEVLPRLRRTG